MAAVLPMQGIRVVDLTWVWAGPYSALQLTHLGAEVIRLESHMHSDISRRIGPYVDGQGGLNRAGSFNQWNQGKRSVALDFAQPEGVALARDLIAGSDVVMENFTPGVIQRLGLGYERLRENNPGLIMLSLSGYGADGSLSRYPAYGGAVMMLSGAASLNGYRGGDPSMVGLSYGDPNGALHGAFAILAALWQRDRTGQGQHIDLSMLESLLAILPEGVMAQVMGGAQPERIGNRDPQMAPHGFFACAGEDRWIALAVRSDGEWRALCGVMNRPELACDPRFVTAQARKRNEDALEELVGAWTVTHDPWQLTERLQGAGVAAFPPVATPELVTDSHLEVRNFFVRLEHEEVGMRVHAGIPWQLSDTPLAVRAPAPLLGADNEYVVMKILGRSRAEYERLLADKVLY
jgi:crotonobetainyl-CoA:carnitine CoA-transferase CaiB-like acyl-CoA transferase